jgi:hypothetical protein
MPPEGPNFILATNIPNSERNVLVFNSLNIESWAVVSVFSKVK